MLLFRRNVGDGFLVPIPHVSACQGTCLFRGTALGGKMSQRSEDWSAPRFCLTYDTSMNAMGRTRISPAYLQINYAGRKRMACDDLT